MGQRDPHVGSIEGDPRTVLAWERAQDGTVTSAQLGCAFARRNPDVRAVESHSVWRHPRVERIRPQYRASVGLQLRHRTVSTIRYPEVGPVERDSRWSRADVVGTQDRPVRGLHLTDDPTRCAPTYHPDVGTIEGGRDGREAHCVVS